MTISVSRRCCCWRLPQALTRWRSASPFALEGTDIALAACLIGLTTFTLSPIGLLVGNRFGLRYKSKAELVGGLVLIGIGLKILLEGLGLFG